MAVTDIKVEIAFDSAPDDPTQIWTDVTQYVRLADGISISRGRSDEQATIAPGQLSLTLDNTGGRFTWGYSGSPYYPNVLPYKRIRVLVYEENRTWHTYRFDGYIDGWPASFAGVSEQPRVTITATDRLARLGRSRQLRDAMHEELGAASYSAAGWVLDDPALSVLGSTTVLSGGLVWLYGLQESSGSSTAGDVSGALGRPTLTTVQVGTDGAIEFGASGLMPEGTAVQFSPASAGNGIVLTKASGPSTYIGGEFTLSCQFAWTGSTGAQLVQVGASPSGRITISVTPTTVVATFVAPDTTSTTVTKTAATGNNRPHFALVTVSAGTIRLHVDALSEATGSIPAGMGSAQGLTIGGTTSANVHQVAWVAYSNVSTTVARAQDLGLVGSAGSEATGARIGRILRWLGIPASDQDLMPGVSQVAYQASGGADPLDLINDVCKVESGRFWATPWGVFAFRDRSYFGDSWVLSIGPNQIDPGEYAMTVDTADIVNDLTVSRPAGATFRMRDESSINLYGQHSASDTIYAATDDALRDIAAFRLARYAHPVPRVPSLKSNVLTESWWFIRSLYYNLDPGKMIVLGSLPAATTPGGVTSVQFVVEGVREEITPTAHWLAFTTSPRPFTFWILDDPVLSVLDDTTLLFY